MVCVFLRGAGFLVGGMQDDIGPANLGLLIVDLLKESR